MAIADPLPLRESFWRNAPELPELALVRKEAITVPRRGPGGASVFDLAELRTSTATVTLLIAIRVPIRAKDVSDLKRHLRDAIDARQRNAAAVGTLPPDILPVLATDNAQPSVRRACLAENVGLIDLGGTVIIRGGPVLIHIEGKGRVANHQRVRLFAGKACRIVRLLLHDPHTPRQAKLIARQSGVSYAYTSSVLRKLEEHGFATRESPRAGFYLHDAGGLLRAWMDAGAPSHVVVEPFFAPNTTPDALSRAWREVESGRHGRGVFTLASALKPEEVHVSGLPHGLYLTGELDPIVAALELRRTTPHNFLVLRADPHAETDDGGIFYATRDLPFGAGVSLPQLVVDFANAAGRGPEQARFLLRRYVDSLAT